MSETVTREPIALAPIAGLCTSTPSYAWVGRLDVDNGIPLLDERTRRQIAAASSESGHADLETAGRTGFVLIAGWGDRVEIEALPPGEPYFCNPSREPGIGRSGLDHDSWRPREDWSPVRRCAIGRKPGEMRVEPLGPTSVLHSGILRRLDQSSRLVTVDRCSLPIRSSARDS